MAGGLLQLAAYGSQNQYLNGNPQMTFFKVVYRRYSNFAMEYIRQNVEGPNELQINSEIKLTCKIDRNADLIKDTYFICTIPDIYSGYDNNLVKEITTNYGVGSDFEKSLYKFKWIKNLGTTMIKEISITIGGIRIDHQYGEWLHIWSEINLKSNKIDPYNKMIGNIPEIYDPANAPGNNGFYPTSSLNPNQNIDFLSPENINNNSVPNVYKNPFYRKASIDGRKLYIPIPFWFCGNSGLALPLIALQYHEVVLHIELRPIIDLYTIIETNLESPNFGLRVKPNALRKDQNISNFITSKKKWGIDDLQVSDINSEDTNITDAFLESENVYNYQSNSKFNGWGLEPYFFINYIFLDKNERGRFAETTHEYLIEQVQTKQYKGILGSKVLDLLIHHPVKQVIWTTQRSDIDMRNDWSNYTNWIYENTPPYSKVFKNINEFIPENKINSILPDKSNYIYYIKNILKNARLLFDGQALFAKEEESFFNLIQPYQYNIRNPKNGIYIYSFSLDNEGYQPTGSCNMSRIKKIQLDIETQPVMPSENDFNNESLRFQYNYNINVYSVNYNILRIMAGMGGLVFSN
jgi:hypothetical protein